MPELPEVQTVVSQLQTKIVGKRITKFWSDWKKRILSPYAVFVKKAKGATILAVRRFGKHIVIDLDNGYSIVVHLKMTGHFLVKNKQNRNAEVFTKDSKNGYIHHIFIFDSGTSLEFSDMRKFGWLRLVKTDEVEMLPSIQLLGIDALSPELTQRHFRGLLMERKRRSIGVTLLEQDLLAGIGNIYRSEILFLAGLLPTRHIEKIKEHEWPKILPVCKKVLRQAIKHRGTSASDFRDTDGLEGSFQKTLYVYGRVGKPCKKCGTMIARKKISQRSAFYCPRCQK